MIRHYEKVHRDSATRVEQTFISNVDNEIKQQFSFNAERQPFIVHINNNADTDGSGYDI